MQMNNHRNPILHPSPLLPPILLHNRTISQFAPHLIQQCLTPNIQNCPRLPVTWGIYGFDEVVYGLALPVRVCLPVKGEGGGDAGAGT
jgi:hypothetical protein